MKIGNSKIGMIIGKTMDFGNDHYDWGIIILILHVQFWLVYTKRTDEM